jgi:hypothetical protein
LQVSGTCSRVFERLQCFGVEACPVHVEVDVSFGMPVFTMVGLPDASVRESRDRVRSAIRNSGFEFPPHRITVNLAPADVRKAGAAFDLPIALGILAASGVIERRHVPEIVLLGECRSTDRSTAPAAYCRSPRRQGATACRRFCCRRRTPARRRSCRASTCSACRRSLKPSARSTIPRAPSLRAAQSHRAPRA